jgi:hypothetical protein
MSLVLKIIALVLFFLAAFVGVSGVASDGRGAVFGRIDFVAAGLFCWLLSEMVH